MPEEISFVHLINFQPFTQLSEQQIDGQSQSLVSTVHLCNNYIPTKKTLAQWSPSLGVVYM